VFIVTKVKEITKASASVGLLLATVVGGAGLIAGSEYIASIHVQPTITSNNIYILIPTL